MSGELFDLDEITRFGWPWHGLWQGDRLVLGNGSDSPVWIWPPIDGDCFRIKVPDMPSVDTTPEEQAEGIEWRNYALLCGSNSVLYNVEMQQGGWVFIDSNKRPWKCRMEFLSKTSATLRIYDLESLSSPVQSITLTFSMPGWTPSSDAAWYICDMNSRGSDLLWAIRPQRNRQIPVPSGWGDVCHLSRLKLSGIPPAVTAVWDTDGIPPIKTGGDAVLTGSITAWFVWHSDTDDFIQGPITHDINSTDPWPSAPSGYSPSYNYSVTSITAATFSLSYVVGGMYTDADALEFLTLDVNYTSSGSGSVTPNGSFVSGTAYFTGGGSSSLTGTIKLKRGDVDLLSLDVATSSSNSYTSSSVTNTANYSIGDFDWSAESTTAGGGGSHVTTGGYAPPGDFSGGNANLVGGRLKMTFIQPQNKTSGVDKTVTETGGSKTRTLDLRSFSGTSAQISPYAPDVNDYYITCHPVTGQIVTDTDVVCFM